MVEVVAAEMIVAGMATARPALSTATTAAPTSHGS
jgi:hypothetical protein